MIKVVGSDKTEVGVLVHQICDQVPGWIDKKNKLNSGYVQFGRLMEKLAEKGFCLPENSALYCSVRDDGGELIRDSRGLRLVLWASYFGTGQASETSDTLSLYVRAV